MTTTREALPEQVRIQVLKMRDLVRTIENAPLNEVVAAIENLKAEIDTLMAHAMEASGAQTQELATAVEEQRKQVEARTEQRLNDLIDKHRRGKHQNLSDFFSQAMTKNRNPGSGPEGAEPGLHARSGGGGMFARTPQPSKVTPRSQPSVDRVNTTESYCLSRLVAFDLGLESDGCRDSYQREAGVGLGTRMAIASQWLSTPRRPRSGRNATFPTRSPQSIACWPTTLHRCQCCIRRFSAEPATEFMMQ